MIEGAGTTAISKKVSTPRFAKIMIGEPFKIKARTFEKTFALVY